MWLITGGKGFIGEHLSQRLSRNKYDFRITTRRKLSADERFDAVQVDDITRSTEWSSILDEVVGVVHLAARAHILKETSENPKAAFYQSNTDGTLRLAEEAVKSGVRRFIYVSSIGVNGRLTYDTPFKESDIPNPHNDYAASKLAAENGLKDIASASGLELVIVRPPLVYGPGVKANFLRLLRIIDKGYPLPLASVKNQRSLVAAENLVDFLNCCMRHPNAAGETFLVTDGEDLSTQDLVRKLAKHMGRSAIMIPCPPSVLHFGGYLFGREAAVDGLVGSLQVDISKSKNLLGWEPPISVEEGIQRTVDWYLSTRFQTNIG